MARTLRTPAALNRNGVALSCAIALLVAVLRFTEAHAQVPQPLPPGVSDPSSSTAPSPPPERYPVYTDLDLAPYLSRRAAPVMTAEVHVRNRSGLPVSNLTASDFRLIANGKPRDVRVLAPIQPGGVLTSQQPSAAVLILLPPNQPQVRLEILRDTLATFSARSTDNDGDLSCAVSLFESTGSQSPYMLRKSDLLAVLHRALQLDPPILLDPGPSGHGWRDEANRAILAMRDISPMRILIGGHPEDPGQADGVHLTSFYPDPRMYLSSARAIDAHVFFTNAAGESTATALDPLLDTADRNARLKSAGQASPNAGAVALIVLPPNQQRVRLLMLHDAIETFSARPADAAGNLTWSVSIFDGPGRQSPYMRRKADILAALEKARHVTTPILLEGGSGRQWFEEVSRAVGAMRDLSPNRIVITGNPDDTELANPVHGGEFYPTPLMLLEIASTIGAQVFVANSGGPLNGPANTSRMMLTASDTGGGYSNSFADLSGQTDKDLLASYLLEFHLDPEEVDAGLPDVAVTVTDRHLIPSLGIVQPAPDAFAAVAASLKPVPEEVTRALTHAVASPAFAIHQRVDYFPIRGGAQPIIPMTCTIAWTATSDPPGTLDVIETVERAETGVPVFSHRLNVEWNGRTVSWERDGQLTPGTYIWRVAAGTPDGRHVASAIFTTRLNPPDNEDVSLSSLVTGRSCRNQHHAAHVPGQAENTATPLLSRRSAKPAAEAQPLSTFDPMIENGCRIEPEPSTHYAPTDTLRSFVRVYIAENIDKGKLDAWSARFILHSANGQVESEIPATLIADSQPGYLAALELPLSSEGLTPGSHTLTFELRGPHIHTALTKSIPLTIDPLTR